MATLNRILLILIVVLALTAAGLSYLLFQRRAEFRQRGEELATTVTDVVEKLDENSKTGTKADVTFTPRDTDAKTPESGSLSWRSFHEAQTEKSTYPDYEENTFRNGLEKTRTLTTAVEKQRNELAEGLFQTGMNLGIPREFISETGLKQLQLEELEYQGIINKIATHAQKMKSRDEEMINTIAECAEVIGTPLSKSRLSERAETGEGELGDFQHEEPLSTFESDVRALKKRSDSYEDTLKAAPQEIGNYDWQVRAADIGSEQERTYNQALETLEKDYSGIEEKLARIPILEQKLAEKKEELKQARKKLNEKREKISELEDKLKEAKSGEKIKKLREEKQELQQKLSEYMASTDAKFSGELKGEILEVNRKWGFVVLDKGVGDVASGTELLVGREGNYVARLKVTRVKEENAVANVMRGVKEGDVRVGDAVEYAPSAMEEEEEEEEESQEKAEG